MAIRKYKMSEQEQAEAQRLRELFYVSNLAPKEKRSLSESEQSRLSTILFQSLSVSQIQLLCMYEACDVTKLCRLLMVKIPKKEHKPKEALSNDRIPFTDVLPRYP